MGIIINKLTVIELGTGDITIYHTRKNDDGTVHLAFKQTEECKPINVKLKTVPKRLNEINPEVLLITNNTKSIDALISILKRCKKELLK